MEGMVASCLVPTTPEQVVWVLALTGDIVLCSSARCLILTVPLSTKEYKWVPVNCWGNLTNCRPATETGIIKDDFQSEVLSFDRFPSVMAVAFKL